MSLTHDLPKGKDSLSYGEISRKFGLKRMKIEFFMNFFCKCTQRRVKTDAWSILLFLFFLAQEFVMVERITSHKR